MLIAFTNQKGGVGKSTLAVHLAVWHSERGSRVAFIDADRQGTAAPWIQEAQPQIEVHTLHDADSVMEEGRRLADDYDIVVADGPAGIAEVTRAILLVADVAVIPCGASLPEMTSTIASVRIIKNCQQARGGPPETLIVYSRIPHERQRLARDAWDAREKLGFPVCRTAIRHRAPVADAPGQGSVVWRFGRRADEAAAEMIGVINEVTSYAERTTKHDGSSLSDRDGFPEGRHTANPGGAVEPSEASGHKKTVNE